MLCTTDAFIPTAKFDLKSKSGEERVIKARPRTANSRYDID